MLGKEKVETFFLYLLRIKLSGIAATTELKSNSNVNTTAGAQIESCTVN